MKALLLQEYKKLIVAAVGLDDLACKLLTLDPIDSFVIASLHRVTIVYHDRHGCRTHDGDSIIFAPDRIGKNEDKHEDGEDARGKQKPLSQAHALHDRLLDLFDE